MDKRELRKYIRTVKSTVPFYEKQSRSLAILSKVEQMHEFVNAKTVLLYWAMEDEVQTQTFVERWYQSKTILLPCVDGDDLLLRQFTGRHSMQKGEQFGIEEPVGPLFTKLDAIDMIVVPGVAFDKCKNRMGRGRGFYDRLLKSTPNACKVGIAFDFQMVDAVPTESFDVKMDKVVSESLIV